MGAAAVAGAALSVNAAIEANQAHLKLQNTFENNKRLSDSSVQAFEDQADALRELTGVDDEAIISAQALLGQFKLTGDEVMQLIPLVVDLSEKMDIDLSAAAKAVGKATQGSAGILSRYGIVLDKDALAADAFGATLKGLGVAQGFAADQAKIEPWRVLRGELEELAEQAGQTLLPVLTRLVEVLGDPLIAGFEGLGMALTFLTDQTGFVRTQYEGLFTSFEEQKNNIDLQVIAYQDMQREMRLASQGVDELIKGKTAEEAAFVRSQQRIEAANEATRELTEAGAEHIQDYIGSVTDIGEEWDLTANKAVTNMQKMVDRARTMANDFRQLDETAVPEKFKRFLIEEGPEAVHAFVEGTARQQGAFLTAWRQYERIQAGAINRMEDAARAGGNDLGAALINGVSVGITTRSELLKATVANAIHEAIEAGKDAAKIGSPSKVMMEVGRDLIAGLVEGFIQDQEKVVDVARSLLDRVLGIARSFRDEIRGGFGSFLDVSGAFGTDELPASPVSIESFFASQVRGAQQFASILSALKRQGASKDLLAEIAGAGPEAIPFAQALLQGGPNLVKDVSESLKTIADVAGDVSERLTRSFFGDKIDALRDQLVQENDKLREANRILAQIEKDDKPKIVVNVNGWVGNNTELARHIREELNKLGDRNVGSGVR